MRLLIDCILFEQRFARMPTHPPLIAEACTNEDGLITEEYTLPMCSSPDLVTFSEGDSLVITELGFVTEFHRRLPSRVIGISGVRTAKFCIGFRVVDPILARLLNERKREKEA
jgi:hypothetical protein